MFLIKISHWNYSVAFVVAVVLMKLVAPTKATATAANANNPIVDALLELFDAPHKVDTFHDAPGHFAEKTIEFLAFGDAAMDYYQ